jgi:hypothetical protein
MNNIMKIMRDEEMKIMEQDFTETCRIKAFIRKSRTAQVLNRLSFTEETSARRL